MTFVEIGPVGRRPFFRTLAHFSAACLIGTLATDIAYWRTADVFWANFSAWLVTVGFFVGLLALLVGLVESVARRPLLDPPTWLYALFGVLTLIAAFCNVMVHTRAAGPPSCPGA
jgi:uncharacterized membrane protein